MFSLRDNNNNNKTDEENLLSHIANTETVMNQKCDFEHQTIYIYMIKCFHGHCALLSTSYV